jgi:multiple sugar transport system substrate-binding protein
LFLDFARNKRAWVAGLLLPVALASCTVQDDRTEIYLQRFFGECTAEYGRATDVAQAEGECGIITATINKFNAQNPDVRVSSNVVAWPGYPQLTAQMAARDPPDLVTMHSGVISDYAPKGCSSRSSPICRRPGWPRRR